MVTDLESSPTRRRAAVLGHPVAHSLSPALHLAAYSTLGLDWSYEAIDVTVETLPAFMAGLDDRWVGLSLTMPLKEAVISLLSAVEDRAKQSNSVNTVTFREGGRQGWNTDVIGLMRVLTTLGVSPSQRVTVLGAGATARSAVAAVADFGVTGLSLCARRPPAVEGLAHLAVGLGVRTTVGGSWPPSQADLTADVVISTLPGSAAGEFDEALGSLTATPGHLVDVVYDPWPSQLARSWSSAGGAVTGGLEMLVHQAVEQVRLMTGQEVDHEVLRTAGLDELERRRIAQGEQ